MTGILEDNIYLGNKIDNKLIDYLRKTTGKILLVTDSNLYAIYKTWIDQTFSAFNYKTHVVEAGEASKSFENYGQILKVLAENKFNRKDIILAFGGGVVGDLAGFCAATYMRGMRFINLATSLLAMVDSSVGGKTAINFLANKNNVGSFYKADLVHIDTEFLKTLEYVEIKNGLAEIIKYGILADREIIDILAREDKENLDYLSLIERSIRIKASYVKGDFKDQGQRAFLNLGHTIGHAIEGLSNYKISHGQAVAMGIYQMVKAGIRQKRTKQELLQVLDALYDKYDLKKTYDFTDEEIFEKIYLDKKVEGDKIRLIIPEEISSCKLELVEIDQVKAWLERG